MIKPNVLYRVTGRYMDGQRLIGYHLVGEDGSQAQESKERVIWLIGKGLITNMRVQIGTDKEVIIRGKGINLNKLPVFDQGKQQFRNNEVSQTVSNSKVSVANSNVKDINKMGQYTVRRRIMYKNQCLGYEVSDYSDSTRLARMSRDKVIELAAQKLMSNVVAHKSLVKETGETKIILRGVGIDLRNLPYLIVDDNGNVIDPLSNKNISVRSAYLKHNGLLKDNTTGNVKPFRAGQFAVCTALGMIEIKSKDEMEREYYRDATKQTALCDDYFEDKKYSMEMFGVQTVDLTKQIIKSWVALQAR